MGLLAVSFEVDLQPGSALGFATTLFVVLLVAYILVGGAGAVVGKLTPMLWPSVAFFGFAVVAILFSQAGDEADVVRITAETDRVSVESGAVGQGADGVDTFSHDSELPHSHDGIAPHSHP